MIAAVARRSGVSPLDVLRLPADLYRALEADVRDNEWGVVEELNALQAEILHAIFRVIVSFGGQRPPAPLHVPRPDEIAAAPEATVVTPGELAGMFQRGEL